MPKALISTRYGTDQRRRRCANPSTTAHSDIATSRYATSLFKTASKKQDITDPSLRDIIDNKRTRIDSKPTTAVLAHDPSCNIACPSCRADLINAKNKDREAMDQFAESFLLPLMDDNDNLTLVVSGDGDPFASRHYRKLLRSLVPARHKGVKVTLHTNALLATPKEWETLGERQSLIKGICVSIDAATADVYEDVRRPGKWPVLMHNMDFIAGLRRDGKIDYLIINFVVQKKNFEQMPAFVELGKKWGAERSLFMKYISRSAGNDLDENCVIDERHPQHARFLEILKHPIMQSKEVNLFGF